MKFHVLPWKRRPVLQGVSVAYLIKDNWNDFGYKTMFDLTVFDVGGLRHHIGGVKIGRSTMGTEQWSVGLPSVFDSLDKSFFSLGQDESYYQALRKLHYQTREEVLSALRDVVFDDTHFQEVYDHPVMQKSLLRFVSPTSVRGQFRRLISGGARLSSYSFAYSPPAGITATPITLSFDVVPESSPPTNIHVLIGSNGVGKTHFLRLITKALVGESRSDTEVGEFAYHNAREKEDYFANLVSVSFSAFDEFELLPEHRERSKGLKYSYVGLRRVTDRGGGIGTLKSHEMLANEFVSAIRLCLKEPRRVRLRKALETLSADAMFRSEELVAITDVSSSAEVSEVDADREAERAARAFFGRLSSGHKIILFTIAKLIETVEERTLVLLDEPEAHLHPPLLSAFVRALSDLLIDRNGVAIVATHSPVVLQEVPSTCVWKLWRSGEQTAAERPQIETFGENVGVLTREAFGLEVTESGFHGILRRVSLDSPDVASVIRAFSGQLGSEARAIASAMIAAKGGEL